MYYINLKFVSVTLNTYWTTIYLPTIIFFLISQTSFWLYLDARWDVYILGKIIKSHFENRNFITNGMCLGNPHVHIRKNFSSFFFFPHPLSCLHMQCLVGKVYYQTKKKKLSKPNELRPNSILFTGFLVLIRYLVYVKFCYSLSSNL